MTHWTAIARAKETMQRSREIRDKLARTKLDLQDAIDRFWAARAVIAVPCLMPPEDADTSSDRCAD